MTTLTTEQRIAKIKNKVYGSRNEAVIHYVRNPQVTLPEIADMISESLEIIDEQQAELKQSEEKRKLLAEGLSEAWDRIAELQGEDNSDYEICQVLANKVNRLEAENKELREKVSVAEEALKDLSEEMLGHFADKIIDKALVQLNPKKEQVK